MSSQVVIAALNLFVFGSGTSFGGYFVKYGRAYNIDPLLAASVAYSESRLKRRRVSRTNDYGLMQLHVGTRTHASYIGREHLLFDPKRNIRLGIRMMFWWKAFHRRNCRPDSHHWLLHYNQGRRVYTRGWRGKYANRVLKIYHKLIKLKSIVLRKRNATI